MLTGCVCSNKPKRLPAVSEVLGPHFVQFHVFSLTILFFCQNDPPLCPDWWLDHNETLPTVEDFLKVWDVTHEEPPADDADPEVKAAYKYRLELFEWYVEKWLPKTTADVFFGGSVRPITRVSGTVLNDGVNYEVMPVMNEAFGQLQFENSRSKWLATFEFQKNHRRGKVPQYRSKDASTHKFKAKWSDDKDGQQCKWDITMADQTLNQRFAKLKEWRKKDEEKGFIGQDLAMKVSRKALDWDKKQEKLGKKGKRAREEDNDDQEDQMQEDADKDFQGFSFT